MSEESNIEENVTLEIEGTPVKCKKELLILHSDYFKAMFKGNFVERDKEVIKLEGVDLKAMDIILCILWDETYFVEEEDLLLVLQTACMLQFSFIKYKCIERITEILSPQNCVKIWLMTEQLDLKSTSLKAKFMALIEFQEIKDMECLLELNLKQLYVYLSNRQLHCQSEMDVFQVCMKWWYENCKKGDFVFSSGDDSDIKTLLCLLSCLNYGNLSESDISEMIAYPDICVNKHICDILNCIRDFKKSSTVCYSDDIIKKAEIFLNSKSRLTLYVPCFVVDHCEVEPNSKRTKMSSSKDLVVLNCDAYGRKRYLTPIDGDGVMLNAIIYYDFRKKCLSKLMNIPKEKCHNLQGCGIVGYKEFIFLFGGEYGIRTGDWNKNFWVFDTFRLRWERKCVMPFKRRHFDFVVCGNYLFIIGGTGSFRLVCEDMYWYSYKEDEWSKSIKLPCPGRQIKCCNHENELFLLSLIANRGYFFDKTKSTWITMNIVDPDRILPTRTDFSLFSYEGHIHVKSEYHLLLLKVEDDSLIANRVDSVDKLSCDSMQSIISDNTLYTLYHQTIYNDHEITISGQLTLEMSCMKSRAKDFIFKDVTKNNVLIIDNEHYRYNSVTHLFPFQYYVLSEENCVVTEFQF